MERLFALSVAAFILDRSFFQIWSLAILEKQIPGMFVLVAAKVITQAMANSVSAILFLCIAFVCNINIVGESKNICAGVGILIQILC